MRVDDPQTTTAAERDTGRVEAFSDGVFAIAVTLLVLTLRVPLQSDLGQSGDLLAALLRQWPAFLAYLISFAFILIMWINHHNMFKVIVRTDHAFLFINGLLLFFITFIPFPTALLADYIAPRDPHISAALYSRNQIVAMVIYSGAYFLTAIAFNALWLYAAAGNRLLDTHLPSDFAASITRRYRFGPLLYLACVALAFISVPVSFVLNAILALFFALPHRIKSAPSTP
ncbi:MAG: hypothetical protein OJF49_002639 [Ktedonobacterales bacterium]|jgi:uncharacterized membrane protein|nr:MAG: hypothetical protein OJF49_002639 [Ktedonobacterales bacterium]